MIKEYHCHISLEHTTAHCNALQHTATCYNTLQHTAALSSLVSWSRSITVRSNCNTPQCTAMHCNALQRTATHCNALQRTATHYNALQRTTPHCLFYLWSGCIGVISQYNTLQHTVPYCNTLQYTTIHCNTLQYTAAHCNTVQHIVIHCNTLQQTATHCNTLLSLWSRSITNVKGHYAKRQQSLHIALRIELVTLSRPIEFVVFETFVEFVIFRYLHDSCILWYLQKAWLSSWGKSSSRSKYKTLVRGTVASLQRNETHRLKRIDCKTPQHNARNLGRGTVTKLECTQHNLGCRTIAKLQQTQQTDCNTLHHTATHCLQPWAEDRCERQIPAVAVWVRGSAPWRPQPLRKSSGYIWGWVKVKHSWVEFVMWVLGSITFLAPLKNPPSIYEIE